MAHVIKQSMWYALLLSSAFACSADSEKTAKETPVAIDQVQTFAPNTNYHCGYDFEADTSAEAEKFKTALSRAWTSADNFTYKESKAVTSRLYRIGYTYDFGKGVVRHLRYVYPTQMSRDPSTQVQEVAAIAFKAAHLSKPIAVGDTTARLLVIESVDTATPCMAQGLAVISAEGLDKLMMTPTIGTSTVGDSIPLLRAEEFFKRHNLTWTFSYTTNSKDNP